MKRCVARMTAIIDDGVCGFMGATNLQKVRIVRIRAAFSIVEAKPALAVI